MQVSARIAVVAAALVLGNTACASIIRGSKADITFRNAPENFQAYEEDGAPVPLQKNADGSVDGQIGFHTRELKVTTGKATSTIELDTRVSVGYVIVDFLLYLFPMAIDYGTSKWTNFVDVDVPAALAQNARPRSSATALDSVASGSSGPLIQIGSSQSSRIQPASSQGPPSPAPPASSERRIPLVTSGKLAVLDFKSYSDALKPEDVRYFTDVVRGATLKASPALQVMTRENLLVLLQATGKDASNCEGECEVDTGRRIGADAVVSGELLKVGSHYKLSLKLHETRDGRLLSTAVASGKSIDELDESAQAAAIDLISPAR